MRFGIHPRLQNAPDELDRVDVGGAGWPLLSSDDIRKVLQQPSLRIVGLVGRGSILLEGPHPTPARLLVVANLLSGLNRKELHDFQVIGGSNPQPLRDDVELGLEVVADGAPDHHTGWLHDSLRCPLIFGRWACRPGPVILRGSRGVGWFSTI